MARKNRRYLLIAADPKGKVRPHFDLAVRLPRGTTPEAPLAQRVVGAVGQLKKYLDKLVRTRYSLEEGAFEIKLVLSRVNRLG